jgi:NRAMP (natural resistance-associated macrophage protein)-like metal ion transporter
MSTTRLAWRRARRLPFPVKRMPREATMAPYDTADRLVPGGSDAHLDAAHVGDIKGAFGSIRKDDHTARTGWKKRLLTLLAIVGPGLIVMVGDNDAGAFGTYTQAGQNYGTGLLWTLLLLAPVLYVNQEMVVRLGVVTGVGHARLIFQRFGKFWGAFSIIDLFLLNALTIVTEFIGVTLGLEYLGLPTVWGVVVAALVTIAAASTGSFRRFERFMMVLVFASLALAPIVFMVHPPVGQIAHDLLVPQIPKSGKLSDVMLLIIAIVGTTVAPWQLFFQQSYVIDKRITPRFMAYEKIDLAIGIVFVIVGGVAMMAFAAAAFAGRPEFGQFTDAKAVAVGLEHHAGRVVGVLFAIALIDASIIGAGAVSLATAYAIGDVFKLNHSLHRKPTEAIGFYLVYAGLIALAAVLVLIPGTPLGLLTNAVQTLAGVLLPSATVFLLLLCNDKGVLGPWRNGPWLNLFTGAVIASLVTLSVILTASVLYPELDGRTMLAVLVGGAVLALAVWLIAQLRKGDRRERINRSGRASWRKPPLNALAQAKLGRAEKIWMGVLRSYLVISGGLVLVRIFLLAIGHHG